MAEWTDPKTSKPKMTSKEVGVSEDKYDEWQREMKKREDDKRREEGIKWLGGPLPFEEYTLDLFDPDLNGTHRYKTIVQDFDIRSGNLYMLGPVGTGKTHLMTAKAHQIYDLGGSVRIFDKSRFVELLEYSGWLTVLKSISFIGLDDVDEFGTGKRVLTAIKLLIQERVNWKKNGIFITTNKPLAALGTILGGKNQDRIDGYFKHLVIPENTPSVRGILKKAKK